MTVDLTAEEVDFLLRGLHVLDDKEAPRGDIGYKEYTRFILLKRKMEELDKRNVAK